MKYIKISIIIIIAFLTVFLGAYFTMHYVNDYYPIAIINDEFILFTFGVVGFNIVTIANFYTSWVLIKLIINDK